MNRIPITSAKLNVVFPEGKLPAIDPAHPEFVLVLGTVEIHGKVNAKAARKLAAHPGGAVLQGKLVAEGSKLNLLDAGFTWIEPRPPAPTADPAFQQPPTAWPVVPAAIAAAFPIHWPPEATRPGGV
jgi:hypothetical protein